MVSTFVSIPLKTMLSIVIFNPPLLLPPRGTTYGPMRCPGFHSQTCHTTTHHPPKSKYAQNIHYYHFDARYLYPRRETTCVHVLSCLRGLSRTCLVIFKEERRDAGARDVTYQQRDIFIMFSSAFTLNTSKAAVPVYHGPFLTSQDTCEQFKIIYFGDQ